MKTRAILVRKNGYVGAVAAAGVAGFALTIVTALLSPGDSPGPRSRAPRVRVAGRDRRHGRMGRPLAGVAHRGRAGGSGPRTAHRRRDAPPGRLEVPTAEAAREVLAALGLDRRAGTSKFHVRRLREYAGLLAMVAIVALPLGLLVCILSPAIGLPVLALLVGGPLLGHVRARVELTVGTDGLDLRSPLGRTFVPHAKIRSVEPIWPGGNSTDERTRGAAYGFDIELEDGSVHRIDTRPDRVEPPFDAVLAAWSASKVSGASVPAHTSTLLARGQRTTTEWLGALRALAEGASNGYRVAALDEQALFAVLVDAAAPRELRAAAAVVLARRRSTRRGSASPRTTSPIQSCAASPCRPPSRPIRRPCSRRSSRRPPPPRSALVCSA